MKGMILLASVLCGMGFITLCGYLLLQRSPELVGKMMTRLQASGRRTLNLSEFQAQHAVAFASGHAFLVALRVSKEVGGNLSEPLQVLAETLRRKAILEGRIQALTAQGRIQGLVMTLFPLLLMGVLYLMQPTMGLLFSTTIGWVVLTVIAIMLLLGYAMIRKIVAIDI